MAPAGFGGRLRGKGRDSQCVDPGPRRAAHPVHAGVRSTDAYLHADITIKEKALALTTPAAATPGRYHPPDKILAFLESL